MTFWLQDYDINNDGSGSGDPVYMTVTDFSSNVAFSRLNNQVASLVGSSRSKNSKKERIAP